MRQMPPIRKNEYGIDYLNQKKEEKKPFTIGALPAAALGIMVGSAITNHQNKKESKKEVIPAKKEQPANYFSQIDEFKNNLGIMFSPIGVTFVLKNKSQNIGFETISAGSMNKEMKDAFASRNAEYFKKYMLLKMYSDINLAEQNMAKKVIEKELSLTDSINKKASLMIDEDDISLEEMAFHINTLDKIASIAPDAVEKIIKHADEDMESDFIILASSDSSCDFHDISIIDEEEKIAGISVIDSVRKISQSLSNFRNDIKIAFLPDRVIFTSGNIVIHTIKVIDMDNESLIRFEKKDRDYFKKKLDSEIKVGQARVFGKADDFMEKKASSSDIRDIFMVSNIHPVIYYLVLMLKYDMDWVDFVPTAIPAILEKDFGLSAPISDGALNKIYSIQVVNRTQNVFESPHALEKVIRAFNDKPIDFTIKEGSEPSEIAFAIDIINRVTPNDNIYDNFSDYVHEYITDSCIKNNVFYFAPTIIDTKEELDFVNSINESILDVLDSIAESKEENSDEKNIATESASKTRMLHFFMDKMSGKIKESKTIRDSIDVFIPAAMNKFDIPDTVKQYIKNQARTFADIEDFLDKKEEVLINQIVEFGLEKKGE